MPAGSGLLQARNKAGFVRIQVNGNQLELRQDDTFLVSYPKSGNTWVRFLLANLVSRAPRSFQDANTLVPDIHNAGTPGILDQVPSPRVLKSHFPFDPAYPRVIYLVRDPRSVAVSQFFFKKRRGELQAGTSFALFLDQFLDGFDDGFGNWGDHVCSWLGGRSGGAEQIMVRFEDLKADTAACLQTMCGFCGIEAGASRLAQAIRNSSMESMRKVEKETGLGRQLQGKGDLSIPFVRTGSTSEWREYFSPVMEQALTDRFAAAMDLGGYS